MNFQFFAILDREKNSITLSMRIVFADQTKTDEKSWFQKGFIPIVEVFADLSYGCSLIYYGENKPINHEIPYHFVT